MSAAPATAGGLAYRPFRDGDLPGVLRLWEEESGWGAITPAKWRKWYVDRPDGACLVMVAEDGGGTVAGQLVFAPTVVRVDGEEVLAVRVGAPIVDRARRRRSVRHPEHPATRLYREGARAAAAAGFRLLYAVPDHAWLPFFRWLGGFARADLACVAVDTASAAVAAGSGDALRAEQGVGFGAEHDALWAQAVERFPVHCAVDRGAGHLRHRIAGHLVLDVRERAGRALAGYAAVRRHDGLLVDVLSRTPAELAPVLAAALAWLAAPPDGSPVVGEVKAMATPALRPALDALGFAPVDYRFAFACTPLDPSLSADRIHPERWYLAPGD